MDANRHEITQNFIFKAGYFALVVESRSLHMLVKCGHVVVVLSIQTVFFDGVSFMTCVRFHHQRKGRRYSKHGWKLHSKLLVLQVMDALGMVKLINFLMIPSKKWKEFPRQP